MALDVALDERAHDGLRRGPHREWLLELLHAGARPGHPGDLGREAFDVLGLLHQERAWNEQRERPVLVPALFDHVVEGARDRLPHRPAVRADDHHAAHAGPVGQLGLADDVCVPAVEVVGHLGDVLHEILLLLHSLFHLTAPKVFMRRITNSARATTRAKTGAEPGQARARWRSRRSQPGARQAALLGPRSCRAYLS